MARYAHRLDANMYCRNPKGRWTASQLSGDPDSFDWTGLSARARMPWSEDMIEQYKARWDWKALSDNTALPWSAELIQRYATKWDWCALSRNFGIPWDEAMIEQFIQHFEHIPRIVVTPEFASRHQQFDYFDGVEGVFSRTPHFVVSDDHRKSHFNLSNQKVIELVDELMTFSRNGYAELMRAIDLRHAAGRGGTVTGVF
jgi:hypothetical protein